MKMKIPDILYDYLESTEQDESKMSKKELLSEAEYIASDPGNWICLTGEWGNVVEDYGYTP
jgi:hypothetical protein